MFSFGSLAFLTGFEALSRLALAVAFIQFGFDDYVSLALPGSIILAAIGALLAIQLNAKHIPLAAPSADSTKFPLGFYSASFMRGLSTAAFLSIDIIIAKHFLSPSDAGLYSMLSLIGKMIYFFGTLCNVFIVPLVSRMMGEGKSGRREFSILYWTTAILSFLAAAGLWITAPVLVPFLLGNQAVGILPYIGLYALAMMMFSISTTTVLYHLSKKEYIFPLLSLLVSVGYVVGLMGHHASIADFVEVSLIINVIYFVTVTFLDLFAGKVQYVLRNLNDAIALCQEIPAARPVSVGGSRILIYNWRDTESRYAGGAETYIQNLAERWVKMGHSVTLFTSNDGTQSQDGFNNEVRIIRRGGFFGVYILAPLYYIFKLRGQFDVIIDSENGIPFFTPLYAHIPIYGLLHHVHQEVFRDQLPLPLALLASFLEAKVMPFIYRNCRFITVSESSKREMQEFGISKLPIEVVHPGVDLSFLTPGIKADIPTISYVGRLKEYKSVDVLIRALPLILEVLPGAHLIIAGDGEDATRLKRIAKETGTLDHISFTGKVSEDRKREIMQESWVCVNPSMMEGWGITTIEANACGTPVVAADVPGLRDSVQNGETGLLVAHGDVTALAKAVSNVLIDRELRNRLAHSGRTWAENFAWEKSSQKFIEAIFDQARIIRYKVPVIKRA
jgi:glycosyltransferase involved in cell wall biosynthesis